MRPFEAAAPPPREVARDAARVRVTVLGLTVRGVRALRRCRALPWSVRSSAAQFQDEHIAMMSLSIGTIREHLAALATDPERSAFDARRGRAVE